MQARIMIASLNGWSGKTVITLGLLRALTQKGVAVQPYKKGPDFIDPGWHRLACKQESRNLDSFFMTHEQILNSLHEGAKNKDLCIVEGAMGLYDGMDLVGSSSSAEIAKIGKIPVILVVDATRITRTAAAQILGCQLFDPEVNIVGVILNKVRGARHQAIIKESIESYCGIPVVGAVPTDDRLHIPDRHLGLISCEETNEGEQFLDAIGAVIAEHVDLASVLALAENAEPLTSVDVTSEAAAVTEETTRELNPNTLPVRIAVIKDPAFCFYYQENLQALRREGADLVFVSSLEDKALPNNIHALYIGGGFPEMFAAELEANQSFRASLKERVETDLPVFAECGGLQYLGRTLITEGQTYEMVGALPFDSVMQEQRQGHGYSLIEATENAPWLESGSVLVGHEHHHSKVINLEPEAPFAFNNWRGQGIDGKNDGICHRKVVAVYTHVHALASPVWAKSFVSQASCYSQKQR